MKYIQVYLKRYFFIIPIIVYCSVVLTHLTDYGTITRVNKHDIHCDPNRIAIQLLKEDDLFKLPLEIPDSLSKKIKQIDLCIGTNGNNDNKEIKEESWNNEQVPDWLKWSFSDDSITEKNEKKNEKETI